MKYTSSIAVILSTLALPALAGSPAETMAASKGSFTASAAAQQLAEELLDVTVVEAEPVVTRGITSPGRQQLAASMRVEPVEYSLGELAQMHLND